MTSTSIDYKPASTFPVWFWHGFDLIYLPAASFSAFRQLGHPLLIAPLEFLKGLCLDLSSSPFLSLQLPKYLLPMVPNSSNMQTTHNYMLLFHVSIMI